MVQKTSMTNGCVCCEFGNFCKKQEQMLCLLVEAADFQVPYATDHLLYRWTCDSFGDESQLRTKDCFLTFLQQHVATSLHKDFTLTVLELYIQLR